MTLYSQNNLTKMELDTPLGPMLAIADESALYLLEFADLPRVEKEIAQLQDSTKSAIVTGKTAPLVLLEQELAIYFTQGLQCFKTPLHLIGTEFQQKVWHELRNIPLGHTIAYNQLAVAVNKPSAARAVANANGANQIAILIPCHRVINADGKLGGYAGGLTRKQWLIDHEKQSITPH